MQEESRRAIAAAFAANLGIAIAKFAGFAVTGAASLLAEAIHSVADSGNQLLLLLGISRAAHPADAKHPPWPRGHNEGNINHIWRVPRGSHFVDGSKGWY